MRHAAIFASLLAAGLSVLAPIAGAQDSIPMDKLPMDTPTTISGVEAVCTGIGEEAQKDPRWLAYPVRLEFSNGGAQYLSGVRLSLASGSGKPLLTLNCDGSWVLLRLNPGAYKATATLMSQPGGGTSSASFAAPKSGQKRVVLDFSVKPNQ